MDGIKTSFNQLIVATGDLLEDAAEGIAVTGVGQTDRGSRQRNWTKEQGLASRQTQRKATGEFIGVQPNEFRKILPAGDAAVVKHPVALFQLWNSI